MNEFNKSFMISCLNMSRGCVLKFSNHYVFKDGEKDFITAYSECTRKCQKGNCKEPKPFGKKFDKFNNVKQKEKKENNKSKPTARKSTSKRQKASKKKQF